MSDWAEGDENEPPKPRQTAGWAWAIVFLIVIFVVVDLLATTTLGTNPSVRFQTVPAKKQ